MTIQEEGTPMRQRGHLSADFNARVVLEVPSRKKWAAEVRREHQLKPDLLSRWKADVVSQVASVFQGDERGQRAEHRYPFALEEALVVKVRVDTVSTTPRQFWRYWSRAADVSAHHQCAVAAQ